MIRFIARAIGLTLLALIVVPQSALGDARIYDVKGAVSSGHARQAPPAPPTYLVEHLGWIEFAYHPSTRDRVRQLMNQADGIRKELSALMGIQVFASTIKVRIAAAAIELEQLSPIALEDATTAASFGELGLVVMNAGARSSQEGSNLDISFRHALAHLALDEASGGAVLPSWFQEGFALHASGQQMVSRTKVLCSAALNTRLLSLATIKGELSENHPDANLASAQSADFVRELIQTDNGLRFAALIGYLHNQASLDEGLEKAFGKSTSELEFSWRESMARRYAFFPTLVGTLMLFGLIWLVRVSWQRMRRRRPGRPLIRRRIRAEGESRVSARAGTAQILAARSKEQRADREPSSDVPKVHHDGRWHTLH